MHIEDPPWRHWLLDTQKRDRVKTAYGAGARLRQRDETGLTEKERQENVKKEKKKEKKQAVRSGFSKAEAEYRMWPPPVGA